MLKSTPEYKNHKKRFQAGYFPSKSRKKNQKKSKILDSIEGSGSVTAKCWWEVNNIEVNEVNTGYQYTNFKLKTTSGISSNTTGKILFDGQEKDIAINEVGKTSQYSNWVMPSTEGTYPYSVVYNNKTVCAGTIKVVDPASNLTAECAITDNSNAEITSGAMAQQIKFKVTNQNTSGSNIQLLLSGKESLWDNNANANINKDFTDTVWWNSGGTLENGFNLPLTVGTYTYTLKTLSGSKELCSVDFDVKGPTATCKIKYNGNEITETEGGTSNISFDVSEVKNVTNNYTGKLNFNGTFKTIDCGNSHCWNNTFTAPAAESDDKDYEFILTTADGGHEICRASLTVKGTGGGSGGTEPDPGTGNGSSDYTLCLGNDGGGWPQTLGISTPGTYQVLHDCLGSQWFYNCSGNVTYNGYDLECNGSEHNQISVSAMPSSGAIITIGSGGSISKLGCDRGSGSSPCATTGVTENTGGGSGGGGSGTEPTPDPGAGGTGTSITITQDDNFGSNLHKIQGTVSVTCKNGPNSASTLRCCPKDCHNGTLSSNLFMGGKSKGTSPRLYDASISCTDGQTVVVKSQDPVYCGVANY